MDIIAHRGASHEAPENTLTAVKLGWQQGADAVEIDVQLSRDGRIVVFHDENTRKITGVNGKVNEQTLQELRALDAGKWKGRQWAGEKIPTLQEVLATIPKGKRLFIEIKCGPEIIPPLSQAVKDSGLVPKQTVFIGFALLTMQLLKKTLPDHKVYWVAKFKWGWKTGRWLPPAAELIRSTHEARLDGLDLGANGPIDARLVEQVHSAGLEVYVWTVDSPAKARKLAQAGVDGITTNRPERLRQKLAQSL